MTGLEIQEQVVMKLEEYSPYINQHNAGGVLLGGQDKLSDIKPIYSYVEKNLIQSANEVLLAVPLRYLKTEDSKTAPISAASFCTRVGVISTDEAFLRIHSLRLSGWKRTLHNHIDIGTPAAEEQDNEFTMGTPEKPVAVFDGESIFCYSVKEGTTPAIDDFRWIKQFAIDDEDKYSENVAEAITLNCAKKIYEVFGNTEQVGLMNNELKSVLEILKK